jgi:predicted nucleic acid-binding protein
MTPTDTQVETYIQFLERMETGAKTCAMREIARRRIEEYRHKKQQQVWDRLLIAAVIIAGVAVVIAEVLGL